METALVLVDGDYQAGAGKTARGLVRHSRKYRIVGVLDRETAGRDAGEVLDGVRRGIPVFEDLAAALHTLPSMPDVLIVGVATFGGYLPPEFRPAVADALEAGITIVSGLHERLADDPEFAKRSAQRGAPIIDIRKPRPLRELRQFSDIAKDLPCLRIPVLGTDASIGKRTTAWMLTEALNEGGQKAALVATGQTGLLQGAPFGIPLDAVPGDFMVGELEAEIVRAHEEGGADIVVIEGQGSISHPAYVCGTRAVLSASQPSGIILVHAPGRKTRSYRREALAVPMPDVEREVELLQTVSGSRVIGLGLNHDALSDDQMAGWKKTYAETFEIPVCDPLVDGVAPLVKAVEALR
jgi:uncharacterized NAD-dependent epimerase/dehydratase family protein